MAYIQKILMTTLLLLAMSDENKGSNENSCCEAPRDQSVVIMKDEKNSCFKCSKNLYRYGDVLNGLDIFTKVNETQTEYKDPTCGGIFICTNETNTSSVTSKEFCNSPITFRISPAKDIHENKDKSTTYEKGQNITLECHVDLTVSYALLWIATYRNGPTKCLFSVEVLKESTDHNISNSSLCCPTEGIYQRSNLAHSHHYLNIENITASQSGEYLCTVFFYDVGAYSWKRVNTTFIQVKNEDPESTESSIVPFIVGGSIGVLVVIGAVLCLLILCLKCKGRENKMNYSQSVAPSTEYECSPYAVSAGQENLQHTIYSKAQEPMSVTVAEYAEVELTPLAACSGAEYSEVGKEPHCIYSKAGVPNKECSEKEVKEARNDACATYSVVNY